MSESLPPTQDLHSRLRDELGDRYRVEQELPAGGMGRVFVATDVALNRRVVIKVVADASRGLDVRRFQQEILLSASLQHPHIVPVFAAGDLDGAPYFVMPFIDGVSLRAVMDDGPPLRSAEVTRMLRDVASALRYAHSRGIVHRDLKPANVMVQAGSVMVLDFGVAKAMSDGHSRDAARGEGITGVGFVVGTPGYMAPEQAAGDPNVDHRADLYAFGVLAFELCAGRAPFVGTPSEVMRQHLASPPPDLAGMRTDLSPGVLATVQACLEKNPSDRPADAGVVLDLLDGVGLGVPRSRPSATQGIAAGGRAATLGDVARSPAFVIPACYAVAAIGLVLYLLHLAETDRVRDGVVAAALVGSLLGLPIALAGGVMLRVFGQERGFATRRSTG